MNLSPVLQAYHIDGNSAQVLAFGTGLINHSWKVSVDGRHFLLQRINDQVFRNPQAIAQNIHHIAEYLARVHPEYYFVNVVPAANGDELVSVPGLGYFRMFPFVQNARAYDVVHTPELAYEAALQFGRFTRNLSGFDTGLLQTTIPGFHDLSWRYRQFVEAQEKGNQQRLREAASVVASLNSLHFLVAEYEQVCCDPAFRIRVTHHDTKISNVLFDEQDKGLCVIDLDTIMPGRFISDVGDMMRTYLSPVSEEEQDFSKVQVRPDYYRAVVAGYREGMREELNEQECGKFFFAGQFMMYMQALRFIADYLNDDVYYGERYPGHNLVRATNQLVLLQRLMQCERELLATK